jgi:hypothetical protein
LSSEIDLTFACSGINKMAKNINDKKEYNNNGSKQFN